MATMMIQGLLPQDFARIKIVADNAKSHVSETTSAAVASCLVSIRSQHKRIRNSPVATVCRWECGAAPQDNVPLMYKLRGPAAATTTTTMVSLPPPQAARSGNKGLTTSSTSSMPMTTTTSLSNVMKPVRRRSLDDAEILSQLHDSLSSLDDENNKYETAAGLANKTAGELIALALQELDSCFALLEESTTSVSDF